MLPIVAAFQIRKPTTPNMPMQLQKHQSKAVSPTLLEQGGISVGTFPQPIPRNSTLNIQFKPVTTDTIAALYFETESFIWSTFTIRITSNSGSTYTFIDTVTVKQIFTRTAAYWLIRTSTVLMKPENNLQTIATAAIYAAAAGVVILLILIWHYGLKRIHFLLPVDEEAEISSHEDQNAEPREETPEEIEARIIAQQQEEDRRRKLEINDDTKHPDSKSSIPAERDDSNPYKDVSL